MALDENRFLLVRLILTPRWPIFNTEIGVLPNNPPLCQGGSPQWMRTSANMPIKLCWMPTRKFIGGDQTPIKTCYLYSKNHAWNGGTGWHQDAHGYQLRVVASPCHLASLKHLYAANPSKPARICCSTSWSRFSTVCPVTGTVGTSVGGGCTGISRTRCTCSAKVCHQ